MGCSTSFISKEYEDRQRNVYLPYTMAYEGGLVKRSVFYASRKNYQQFSKRYQTQLVWIRIGIDFGYEWVAEVSDSLHLPPQPIVGYVEYL